MFDTQITVQGWVGGPVTSRQAGESTVAGFRIASTPRHFSRKSQEWVDAETQWYTVKAWRALGENCLASLAKGDPVVVHGRLEARSYVNSAGVETLDLEVEAVFVGHDLNRGTTTFARTPRPSVEATAAERSPSAGAPGDPGGPGDQVDPAPAVEPVAAAG